MSGPDQSPLEAPHYRRRIFVVGLTATAATCAIGAPIYLNGLERDLERRVPAELSAAGFDGIVADFSGQAGTLTCAAPLSDPDAMTAAAYDVWGVHSIELDRGCRVNLGSGDATAETDAETSADPAASAESASAGTTITDLIAADAQLSYLSVLVGEAGLEGELSSASGDPMTLFAPSEAAFQALPADLNAQLRADPELLTRVLRRHLAPGRLTSADLVAGALTMADGSTLQVVVASSGITIDEAVVTVPDLLASNGVVHIVNRVLIPDDLAIDEPEVVVGGPVAAVLADSTLTLSGVVASEVERAALVNAARFALPAGTVSDQLTVDPAAGIDGATAERLATLIAVMSPNLVAGESGFEAGRLYVTGTYADEAGAGAVNTAAQSVEAEASLAPLPAATEADAAALEAALNEFVAVNPIRFEPSQALLADDAAAVLDQVAAQAGALSGITIVVEGHTDSDGDDQENQRLSELRAIAVRDALVARGIDPASITAAGFGSSVPVLVDGVEDKDASRRVEFRIEAAA